jgi:serine/threonine protein kinase/Flp pilus assembly protein TadD
MPAQNPFEAGTPAKADATNALDDPAATTGGRAAGSVTPLPSSNERYKLGTEIARGGMGVVYQARDTILDREVAIKVLRERYGVVSLASRRFADEARISAQLQHPAIPPIHDLGTLPDGRPFLAMKLIKGNTLEELLGYRTDPSQERGRFFAVFEQICQALAYAHSHNVIHRDLKPANVMVGSFGEVQVMDWGLAKVLGSTSTDSAAADETTAQTLINSQRDTDDTATQAGSILGTPAFMPPEQAIGAIGKIDLSSDVFGLGGILAMILTGRPPFSASSAETTRLLAARGELNDCFARLDSSGADPEHIALCKQCLAPKKENRPADAGEVAKAVAALRTAADERARQAELNRAKAEAESREQRKRRKVQLALAGALGLLLLLGGASVWWWQKQETDRRQKELDNRQAAESALELAEAALKKDDPFYGEIDAALDQAERRISTGDTEVLRPRLEGALAARKLLQRLDQIADQRWTVAQGSTLDTEGSRSGYRTGLRDYGLDLSSEAPQELAQKINGSLISARIKEALDAWLEVGGEPGLPALLAVIDPEPARTAIRKAITESDETILKTRTEGLDVRQVPPSFAMLVGQNKLVPSAERMRILREAQLAHPSHFGLAMAAGYAQSNRTADERLAYYRVAVALRRNNATAHNNLGWALQEKKDLDGALLAYRESLRLEPKYAKTHNNLGWALQVKGDAEAALIAFRKALELDPNLPLAHNNLAVLHARKGDPYGAMLELQEANRLDSKLALVHNNMAANLQFLWRLDESVAESKKALECDPDHSNAYLTLAQALKKKDDHAGAIAAVREAIQLSPSNAQYRFTLGLLLRIQEDHNAAVREMEEAVRLAPKNSFYHVELGWTYQYLGDLDRAIAQFQEAVRVDPQNSDAKLNLDRAIRMKELLPHLPDVIAGKTEPKTPADACVLALCCAMPFQNRYACSTRLYDKAFRDDPKIADDRQFEHRWYAACYAARAARGDGIDSPQEPAERAKLREKAYDWFQAEWRDCKKMAASTDRTQRVQAINRMDDWLKETEIRELREPFHLKKLPVNEAKKWIVFWDEVRAVYDATQRTNQLPKEKW